MESYDHVAYQDNDIKYFIPWLFKHSLYYNNSRVYVLIADLLDHIEKSRHICANHYAGRISCIFWNNHPIEKICVLGCVVGYKWRLINGEDYIFLTIDDCTSRPDNRYSFLVCKCSKANILGYGLQLHDLFGRKLRVYGYVDLRYGEFQTEFIEICDDLTLEIEHWERALKQREELAVPWEMDQQLLQVYFTQDNNECDMPTSSSQNSDCMTPIGKNHHKNFIEGLQIENLKDELEIASPYYDSSSVELRQLYDDSFTSPAKPNNLRVSLEDNNSVIEAPKLVDDAQHNEGVGVKGINIYNSTRARKQLLRYLMAFSVSTISVVELYQISQINDVIDDMSMLKFQQQNLALVKPFEQVKTEIFFEIIGKLNSVGLLKRINDKFIDVQPLQKLYVYCTKRLLALIKLQCYSCTIDHDHICERLSLPRLSHRAVVDVFKESLRTLTQKHPQLIASWWIEMNTGKASFVHLEYKLNK